jgi:hypothetical protein
MARGTRRLGRLDRPTLVAGRAGFGRSSVAACRVAASLADGSGFVARCLRAAR